MNQGEIRLAFNHNILWFVVLRRGGNRLHSRYTVTLPMRKGAFRPVTHRLQAVTRRAAQRVQEEGFTNPRKGLYLFHKSLICNPFRVVTILLATQRRPSQSRANAGLNDPIPLGLSTGRRRPQLQHIVVPRLAFPFCFGRLRANLRGVTSGARRFRIEFQEPNAELVGGQDVLAVVQKLEGLLEINWVIGAQRRELFRCAIGQPHPIEWPRGVEPAVANKKRAVDEVVHN